MEAATILTRGVASGIPVVETWDLTPTPIDRLVGFSHEAVAQAVCAHLHAKGRRRLAVIAASRRALAPLNPDFLAAALQRGLSAPPVHEVAAPTTLGDGRTGLRALLAGRPDIDAVFCSSDLMALGVLTEAGAMGIAVPQALAVIGFGDLDFARDTHPALSTVRIDGSRIGSEAARCIVEQAQGREVVQRVIDIGFSIIERASA